MVRNSKSNRNNGQVTGRRTRTQGAGSEMCTITSTKVTTFDATGTNGVGYFGGSLDPMNQYMCNPACTAIGSAYEFYRVKSFEVEFVPSGGTNAVGHVQHCFVANAEMGHLFLVGSAAQRDSIVSSETNMSLASFSAPSRKRMMPNRTFGRTWYQSNFTLASTVDDYDRTVQAVYAARYVGPASTTPAFTVMFHATYEFRGLGRAGATTLLAQSETPRYPYQPDVPGPFPASVILATREGKEQQYWKPKDPAPDPPLAGGNGGLPLPMDTTTPEENPVTEGASICHTCGEMAPGSNHPSDASSGNARIGGA